MPTPLLGPDIHVDWAKIFEGGLTLTIGGAATWLLGRRAQRFREKIDTRTQDQKNIDQLLGRVGTLEGQMTTASEKIEDLRSEKVELQVQIVDLRRQIALLEVKKAEFESRETLFTAHIRDLEDRLTAKTEELRFAEERLRELEAGQRLLAKA